MPVVKIPVVKKFGIISTKYYQEIQRRLRERNEEGQAQNPPGHRKPLEVTEEFIKQFNAAKELKDQERMLDSARKMLHRCKARLGLHLKNSGNHVNLHLAWTDLILLTQCKGKVQEEALDLLILSMDEVVLNEEHIALLCFIAESVLYRICCDGGTRKPYLFSSEVKLSKLGLLTFLRLYAFHLLGKLRQYEEKRDELTIYLKALKACEASHQHYPNVLSVHIMLKVGEAIYDLGAGLEQLLLQKQTVSVDQSHFHPGKAEISQFLWHCLLIWQHSENNSRTLHDIIKHLLLLKEHLQEENWLESIIAIFILGEAAKKELSCLEALMDIGSDILSLVAQKQSSGPTWPCAVLFIYTMTLAHVCLHGTTSEIQKYSFIGFGERDTLNPFGQDASLINLLFFKISDVSDNESSVWIIRYCGVYSLVQIFHILKSDMNRDGLRNAIWNALHKHKSLEKDVRVLTAEKVAEAEVNGPTNPFINTTRSSPESLALFQHVGVRLAGTLAQCYLPPVEPRIPAPRKAFQSCVPKKATHIIQPSVRKKASCHSSRQKLIFEKPPPSPRLDFNTRMSMDLRKIMEEQWEKELQIKMKEEQEAMRKEQQEKARREEEHEKEIIKKREEKLKKSNKPYELPSYTT